VTEFTKALIGGAVFCIVLGVAGGLLTKLTPWYDALKKPGWKPPDWSFGPIWTLIFGFITFAIAYAWSLADATQRPLLLAVLAVNGILNIAWSGIFFMMRNLQLAFIELLVFWLSIVALIYVFASISSFAALLLVPYLLWVTAAGLLNYQVMRLNTV
jgi:translocator protein